MKTKSTNNAAEFARIDVILAERGPILAGFPGVVEVWAGFKFRKGRLTNKPAIIVSVLTKRPISKLKKAELLPTKLDGVPVDVVPASGAQLVRFALVHDKALTKKSAPKLAGMVTASASFAAGTFSSRLSQVETRADRPEVVSVDTSCALRSESEA